VRSRLATNASNCVYPVHAPLGDEPLELIWAADAPRWGDRSRPVPDQYGPYAFALSVGVAIAVGAPDAAAPLADAQTLAQQNDLLPPNCNERLVVSARIVPGWRMRWHIGKSSAPISSVRNLLPPGQSPRGNERTREPRFHAAVRLREDHDSCTFWTQDCPQSENCIRD
jgi:hypothetical protein